jgi:hypothetical protein
MFRVAPSAKRSLRVVSRDRPLEPREVVEVPRHAELDHQRVHYLEIATMRE